MIFTPYPAVSSITYDGNTYSYLAGHVAIGDSTRNLNSLPAEAATVVYGLHALLYGPDDDRLPRKKDYGIVYPHPY